MDAPSSPSSPPPLKPSSSPPDALTKALIPVGRSGWAIAAGYLGLFSFLVLPAPLSLLVSIIALWHIRHRSKIGRPLGGIGRALFGLIMGVIGTALVAWWGFPALSSDPI